MREELRGGGGGCKGRREWAVEREEGEAKKRGKRRAITITFVDCDMF